MTLDTEPKKDEGYEVDQRPIQDSGLSILSGDYAGALPKTSKEEVTLVRKLDFYIMPILWVMYFMYVLTDFHLTS